MNIVINDIKYNIIFIYRYNIINIKNSIVIIYSCSS